MRLWDLNSQTFVHESHPRTIKQGSGPVLFLFCMSVYDFLYSIPFEFLIEPEMTPMKGPLGIEAKTTRLLSHPLHFCFIL